MDTSEITPSHLLAKRKTDRSGVIQHDGIDFHYICQGNGRPCLVLGSSIFYPRTFSQCVMEDLELIFVDLRHFTTNKYVENTKNITIESYVEDIEYIRKFLDIENFIILGHSLHGSMAIEYAKRYQKNVSHVVAISALPVGQNSLTLLADDFWDEDAADARKERLINNWQALDYEAFNNLKPSELIISSFIRDGPKYWYNMNPNQKNFWDGVEFNFEVWRHVWETTFAGYDAIKTFEFIQAPIFLALGRYDYTVPYSCWNTNFNKFSNLTRCLFEKSGHFPQTEEPLLFSQKLMKWVNKHRN